MAKQIAHRLYLLTLSKDSFCGRDHDFEFTEIFISPRESRYVVVFHNLSQQITILASIYFGGEWLSVIAARLCP